jgi:hypothetical protein
MLGESLDDLAILGRFRAEAVEDAILFGLEGEARRRR